MAKYNRSFLVPYLEDICSLHLYKNKLLKRTNTVQQQIDSINCGTAGFKPTPPKTGNDGPFFPIVGLIVLAVGALVFYLAVCDSDSFLIELLQCFDGFIIAIALFILGAGVYTMYKDFSIEAENKKIDKENEEIYKRNLERYNQAAVYDTSRRNSALPGLQNELAKCKREISSANSLLEKAYSANVIAKQYRDIYVAVYLCKYFKSSGEDDVDSVLKLFVLEQIKARLDIVIAQQSETIVNQRAIMAQQDAAIAQQNRHNAEMKQYAQQIASSQEEQRQYLSMIETNTAATAFFVTADYINRHL